tara:strand:- start:10 stop:1602 length:1593 start_codon:yes stop_codon:yes gene_type:complete
MSERNVNTGMRKKLVSLENFLKDKKPRIINSPRSLEACLRQGLDPAELIPKSLAQFQAEENLREVAQVKFEHHEERRNEKMEQARAERAVIVNFLEEARKSGSTRLSPSFQKLAAASAPSESGVSVAGSGNDEMESSMLREEMKRVDMLRKRQQKDIEQMMSFEMNIVKMQKEQKRLEEMEEIKKKSRAADREKKRLASVQRRAKMEMSKKMAADDEEERMKDQARRDYAFAEKQKKEGNAKAKALAKESRQKDLDRTRLAAQRAQQMKDNEAAQEAMVARRLAKMKEQEDARVERMRQERAATLERNHRKKTLARQRIKKAQSVNESIMIKRREDFWDKEASNNTRLEERQNAERELQALKTAKLDQKNKKRNQARNQAAENDEANSRKIARAQAIRMKRVAENASGRYASDMVGQTKAELRKKDKRDNIERMKRIDEFVRLQTLQKIAADDQRTKDIAKQKQDLMSQRQMMGARQRLSKAKLQSGVEKLRQTQRWDKLDSIINEALSPDAGKKKKRKKKKGGTGSKHP